MKKRIGLFCLGLVTLIGYAQTAPSNHYTAGVLQRVRFEDGKPVAATLMGLDVEVFYGEPAQSYRIIFRNQHGQLDSLLLDYTAQRGQTKRMHQRGTAHYYFLVDQQLGTEGMLLLQEEQGVPDVTAIITGLHPVRPHR